ncbi:DUF397 domain-containing protein [Streptomyces sp. NRRL F-5053]|uniref:DUF397 domain-containing protein n=1 Tax=Streptomyces sp. NRRL F-5053 TaxID=1463854 RepID=UPI0004C68357|nr:DUF397 domain-containing protein [Streptomyces sp. NRRL F-5053]
MCATNYEHVAWHRSSYSGTGGNCVEVAVGLEAAVPVRDSKVWSGPVVLFGRPAWTTFLATVRDEATER